MPRGMRGPSHVFTSILRIPGDFGPTGFTTPFRISVQRYRGAVWGSSSGVSPLCLTFSGGEGASGDR